MHTRPRTGVRSVAVGDDQVVDLRGRQVGAQEPGRARRKRPVEQHVPLNEGGPVGLGTISAAINEEKDSIETIIEPYLIQIGFLNRTPRGRMATPGAFRHFGLDELLENKKETAPRLFDK